MAPHTLKTGDDAWFDGHGGPVRARVLSITGTSGPASADQTVLLEITGENGIYGPGDMVRATGLNAVPLEALDGERVFPYDVQTD